MSTGVFETAVYIMYDCMREWPLIIVIVMVVSDYVYFRHFLGSEGNLKDSFISVLPDAQNTLNENADNYKWQGRKGFGNSTKPQERM